MERGQVNVSDEVRGSGEVGTWGQVNVSDKVRGSGEGAGECQ